MGGKSRVQGRKARERAGLAVAGALCALYLGSSALVRSLTGRGLLDGILGIVLGLFICSLPVRHFLDILVYWRTEETRRTRRALSVWLAANAAVLLGGWLVIVDGATRFIPAS